MPRQYGRTSLFTGEPTKQNEYGTFGAIPWLQSLWDDLTGVTSQNREFEQQEYLMEKEMDWKNPVNQMAMMRQAGINPAVAAQGIAGTSGSSVSAPAVSSSGNQSAAALGSLSSLLSAITSAPSQLANANETNELLQYKKDLLFAQGVETLEKAGLNHWEALSIQTLLPEQSANARADLYLKVAQYDNIVAEYDKIVAEHDRILEDIKVLKQQGSLLEAQTAEADENARYKKIVNDFFSERGFDPNSPTDVSLRNSVVMGRKSQAEAIANGVETYNYSSSRGQQHGVSDFAFRISNATANGQNVSDIAYGRLGSTADFCGRIAHIGTNILTEGGKKAVEGIKNAFSRGDAKKVREELTMVLNNAYEQLDKFADDKDMVEHCNQVIEEVQCALQLSNTQLLQWYKDKNQ